jgi:hypothetical protein
MGVNKTAARIQALREELMTKGAEEEYQRLRREEEKNEAERLRSDLAEYSKERDSAFEALNKEQAEYDKQLLALSAGILALSLSFIKDVVPLKDAMFLWVLDLAWLLLVSCICLVLWSFQFSIHGQLGVVRYWDLKSNARTAEAQERLEIDQHIDQLWAQLDRHSKLGKRMNIVSGLLFAVGVLFLVGFVVLNVERQAHSVSPAIQPGGSDPTKPKPPQRTFKVPLAPQANSKVVIRV